MTPPTIALLFFDAGDVSIFIQDGNDKIFLSNFPTMKKAEKAAKTLQKMMSYNDRPIKIKKERFLE